jgi:hypothetical protein
MIGRCFHREANRGEEVPHTAHTSRIPAACFRDANLEELGITAARMMAAAK